MHKDAAAIHKIMLVTHRTLRGRFEDFYTNLGYKLQNLLKVQKSERPFQFTCLLRPRLIHFTLFLNGRAYSRT